MSQGMENNFLSQVSDTLVKSAFFNSFTKSLWSFNFKNWFTSTIY